jgi:hypothetical protein
MNYETAALADILSKNYSRYVADDEDIGLVVRYIGDEASATVTVASGDLTFKHGDAASEAVDDTIDSGGDDEGVIDVSDANANTMGKVVDLINASANWEARLVDCLRADAAAGYLKNLSEETITPNTETLNLPKDTSAALNLSISLSNTGIQAFLDSLGSPFEGDANYYIKALYGTYVNTYGSGTSKIQVYDIDPVAGTEKKIFEEVAADTTVQGYSYFYLYDGLDALEKGHTLLYRLIGSAACTGWVTASWNMKEY